MLTVSLLEKIAPLYGLIAVGFILARITHLKKELLSFPLIYVITPIICFNAAYTATLSVATLSLPILFFVVCSCICIGSLWLSKAVIRGFDVRSVFAFMSGETNVGYFGIPAAAALYGGAVSSIVALCALGFILYESTVGYFVAARGKSSAKASLHKLIRLPAVYAFVLGFACNAVGLHLAQVGAFDTTVAIAKFCLTVAGMALVGFAAANLTVRDFDLTFLVSGLTVRFIVWPLLAIAVIALDSQLIHIYTAADYKAILLIATLPTAASAAVFATQLKNNPERVSSVILVSTAIALVYVPLISALVGARIT